MRQQVSAHLSVPLAHLEQQLNALLVHPAEGGEEDEELVISVCVEPDEDLVVSPASPPLSSKSGHMNPIGSARPVPPIKGPTQVGCCLTFTNFQPAFAFNWFANRC